MTIDDQIRDEKLQYDINREAAKISALSSGKLHKYEYLTGEDILPSNQQQIIEQARFNYSPLGKAFEKQIKTIEDQEIKQVDALKDLKDNRQKLIKAMEDWCDNNEKHWKYKEVFNKLSSERIGKIDYTSKEINFNNLTYHFKGSNTAPINFIDFRGSMHIYNDIKNGNISIEKIEEDQKQFQSKLNEINPKHKSKDQLDTIKNIKKSL